MTDDFIDWPLPNKILSGAAALGLTFQCVHP